MKSARTYTIDCKDLPRFHTSRSCQGIIKGLCRLRKFCFLCVVRTCTECLHAVDSSLIDAILHMMKTGASRKGRMINIDA